MKHDASQVSTACHDAKRIMSVPYAHDCAARFTNALRFSFYAYFAKPKPIRGN